MTLFSAVTSVDGGGVPASCALGVAPPRAVRLGALPWVGDIGGCELRVGVCGWAICGGIDLCLGVGGGRTWG